MAVGQDFLDVFVLLIHSIIFRVVRKKTECINRLPGGAPAVGCEGVLARSAPEPDLFRLVPRDE
jgi:hypothetical protein